MAKVMYYICALLLLFKLTAAVSKAKLVRRGQFTYIVRVFVSTGKNQYNKCTGSILNNNWVLTAAECGLNRTGLIEIHYGGDYYEDIEVFRVSSKDFHPHPKYLKESGYNIALINTPWVAFTKYIKPVMLPLWTDSHRDFAFQNVSVVGWLSMTTTHTVEDDELLWLKKTILAKEVCTTIAFVSNGKLCTATAPNEYPCIGDPGEPVVDVKEHTLLGIVESGTVSGCGIGAPAIHTRVASHLEWIRQVTGVYYG